MVKGFVGALVGIATALTNVATGSTPAEDYRDYQKVQQANREESANRSQRHESSPKTTQK